MPELARSEMDVFRARQVPLRGVGLMHQAGRGLQHFDGMVHVGVDAQLAGNCQRFAHDGFC